MAVFGAEQVQKSKLNSRYFDKYMVAINIGAMLATLIISFYPNETERIIFKECLVATSILFLAAMLFLAGWKYYIHIDANETVVTKCIPVIISAFQSWRQYKKNKRIMKSDESISSASNLLNVSGSLTVEDQPIEIYERPSRFLDFAKLANHGKFHDRIVDDIKSLRNAILVFCLLTPYWLLNNQVREILLQKISSHASFSHIQMYSTFPLQGQHMNGADDNQIVVGRMWLGDPITIISKFVGEEIFSSNKQLI